MSISIRNIVATGSVLAVVFSFTPSASALDAGLFLHATASYDLMEAPTSIESSVPVSEPSVQERESDIEDRKAVWNRFIDLLSGKKDGESDAADTFLRNLLGAFWLTPEEDVPENAVITAEDMATVRTAKVGDISATLTWSSSKLTDVTVYYSSESPVLISDKTPSASPWKTWSPKQVTLRGLVPDTTYYYKVVAVNALGTTTSAEARFKTVAR